MAFGKRTLSMDSQTGGGSTPAAGTSATEDVSFQEMGIDLSSLGITPNVGSPSTTTNSSTAASAPAGGGAAATVTEGQEAGSKQAPTFKLFEDDDDNAGQTPNSNQNSTPEGQAAGSEEVTYLNHADLVLNTLLGENLQELELDGQRVAIADLTDEQQAEVIVSTFEDTYNYYRNIITQLETQLKDGTGAAAPAAGANEVEAAVLAALRAGNTADLMAAIEQHDPVVSLERMSDEERVRHSLKQQHPKWTDDDIQDEMGSMREAQIQRRSRELMEIARDQRAQTKLDYLASLGTAAEPAAEVTAEDIEAQTAEIRTYAQGVNRIGDIAVNPENVNYLLHQVTTVDANGDTPFFKKVSTPQGLLEAAFWLEYGPKMREQATAQREAIRAAAYEEARRDIVLGNFPNEPRVTSQRSGQQPGTPFDPSKVDWNNIAAQ